MHEQPTHCQPLSRVRERGWGEGAFCLVAFTARVAAIVHRCNQSVRLMVKLPNTGVCF